ncbi:PaaX family transcriptional regulator C-terminal domain-containing protein [Microbacterium sp. SSM24]|uniref:PaaX family transcriptional regulator n=1 Tax=Microbacterium sp. SSM24 TaxID=2991714 RepID=UPI0022273DDB|nr:PaaX family transcriptional regulator C-terminal domain-containing protein [Microbacterium sp. SSM24]MCW3492623.1 transcriptional regulator [Microbacterium sp. SSM24]
MAPPLTNDADGRRQPDAGLAPLIVSLFALYARPEGNWLSISAVVALMADLGVDAQAVRSAIWRLKRRGILLSERRARAAGYSLATSTLEIISEGDVRIFERARATVDDGWVLAVFSVPESERQRRHEIRVELTRLGFGTVSPGVWIAPATLVSEADHSLTRRGLSSYVDLFIGSYAKSGSLRGSVDTWWDLDELRELYGDFLSAYRPARRRMSARAFTPREAFEIYVPLLTDWRRLPYRDPGLPLSLLPPNWKGEIASELFVEMNTTLRPLARKHATALIHGTAKAPPLEAST